MQVGQISVRNISKRFEIGETVSHDTMRDAIMSRVRRLMGRSAHSEEDSQASNRGEMWALKDVSFEVNPGEVVGIIGRNGSGKSTLLKILSQITEPTTGEAIMRGRVSALLEVGTGFHPELTGRENIFMNGAILGMKRHEIRARFNDIVEFAGVGRYIDTPVKRYSSGMYVRLAFAVTAHLDPDILLVDEVLAVGDSEFQDRCLGRMKEVCNEGRSVLFVSHQMNMVTKLCNRGVLLNKGDMLKVGPIDEVVRAYLQGDESGNKLGFRANPESSRGKKMWIESILLLNAGGEEQMIFNVAESIDMVYTIRCPQYIRGVSFSVTMFDMELRKVFVEQCELAQLGLPEGCESFEIRMRIPDHFFQHGVYSVESALHVPMQEFIDYVPHDPRFEMQVLNPEHADLGGFDAGVAFPPCTWTVTTSDGQVLDGPPSRRKQSPV